MVNIEQELANNQSILLLIPSMQYNEVSADVAKQLSSGSLCYVTLNKTFASLKESFAKEGINLDNLVFIDAISKSIKMAPEQTDSAYFVSSPSAMTELSLAMTKFLKHNFDYIIFDSFSNLLIYHQKDAVVKFISSIVNKIKASNTKAVFYAIKSKEHEGMVQQCSMFVDKVIDMGVE